MSKGQIKGIYGTTAKAGRGSRDEGAFADGLQGPMLTPPAAPRADDRVIGVLVQIRDDARAHHRKMRLIWFWFMIFTVWFIVSTLGGVVAGLAYLLRDDPPAPALGGAPISPEVSSESSPKPPPSRPALRERRDESFQPEVPVRSRPWTERWKQLAFPTIETGTLVSREYDELRDETELSTRLVIAPQLVIRLSTRWRGVGEPTTPAEDVEVVTQNERRESAGPVLFYADAATYRSDGDRIQTEDLLRVAAMDQVKGLTANGAFSLSADQRRQLRDFLAMMRR
ncbi:MAG: hypothetical protein AB7O32_00235 [Vicinamibacterales bacterium]